jgi:hypothetical protein
MQSVAEIDQAAITMERIRLGEAQRPIAVLSKPPTESARRTSGFGSPAYLSMRRQRDWRSI